MSKLAVGRTSRSTYWMLIAVLFVLKIMLPRLAGALPASTIILVLTYFVMASRFQDFGAPAWLAGSLLGCIVLSSIVVIFVMASPGGQFDARSLPQGAMLALLLPELLLTLVAGTVPGHAGKNRFGMPNQGLAGVILRRVESESAGDPPATDRIKSALGRDGGRQEPPMSSGVILNRVRAKGGASATFGRR